MNLRHAIIFAVTSSTLVGASICQGSKTKQPSAPPLPPSFVQNQKAQQAQQRSAQRSSQTTSSTSSSSKSQKNTGTTSGRQRQYYQPYYGSGYGTGYGYNNGNAANNGNVNNNNNAPPVNFNGGGPLNNGINLPAAGVPAAMAPAAPAPTADPEVTQATADLNVAMDKLRANLMQTSTEYAQAVAARNAAQAENAALIGDEENPNPERLVASANRVLAARQKIADLERDAIAKDQTVQDAQAHLKTVMEAHAK